MEKIVVALKAHWHFAHSRLSAELFFWEVILIFFITHTHTSIYKYGLAINNNNVHTKYIQIQDPLESFQRDKWS